MNNVRRHKNDKSIEKKRNIKPNTDLTHLLFLQVSVIRGKIAMKKSNKFGYSLKNFYFCR